MAVKEYKVVKDGEVLKTYKSLPAAKQLAEKEIANVYVGEECVYKVVPEEDIISSPVETVKEEEKEYPIPPTIFTLKTLMNVRKEPSTNAEIVKTLPVGTKVEVEAVVDDWMHLCDGTYILYSGGKYASKD